MFLHTLGAGPWYFGTALSTIDDPLLLKSIIDANRYLRDISQHTCESVNRKYCHSERVVKNDKSTARHYAFGSSGIARRKKHPHSERVGTEKLKRRERQMSKNVSVNKYGKRIGGQKSLIAAELRLVLAI